MFVKNKWMDWGVCVLDDESYITIYIFFVKLRLIINNVYYNTSPIHNSVKCSIVVSCNNKYSAFFGIDEI